jgi:hypothetical protein
MGLFGKKRDESGKEPLEKVIGYKGKGGWFGKKDRDDTDRGKKITKRISGGFGNIGS